MKWAWLLVFLVIGSISLPLDVRAQVPGLTPSQKIALDQAYARAVSNAILGAWVQDDSLGLDKLDEEVVTEEVFVAQPAYGITDVDITAWNSYGPRITSSEGNISTLQSDMTAAENDINDLETDIATWLGSWWYTNRASVTDWADLDHAHYVKAEMNSAVWQTIIIAGSPHRIQNMKYSAGKTDMWQAAAYAVTNLISGDVYLVAFSAWLIRTTATDAYATIQLQEAGGAGVYTPTLYSGPVTASLQSFHGMAIISGPGSTKLDLWASAATAPYEIRYPVWTVTWLGNYL